MKFNYIEFDDPDDPNSTAHPDNDGIYIRFNPRGCTMLLPNAGQNMSRDDQDMFENLLKLAYYQGKTVGKNLK